MPGSLKRLAACLSLAALVGSGTVSGGIYDFRGGVRIPAGSCASYPESPGTTATSINGGLRVTNPSGRIRLRCVCALPIPEKAKVRQFVMVGNVRKGEIFAYIGAVHWNQPREVPFYANLSLLPSTPVEVPAVNQKKVVGNLPAAGSESLTIDRINAYFIEAEFKTNEAATGQDSPELFYFEVYWD
ncbi:MAG: hypothetical protein M3547_01850 [Acidobacteriota bacterium]|nr:hypothetical protein [Acidobacteriota bacterium]